MLMSQKLQRAAPNFLSEQHWGYHPSWLHRAGSQKRGRPRLKWGVHAAVGCAAGLAAGVAIVHVGAEVEEVVGHAGAEAQVAHAVVAPRILPLLVAHAQHLSPQEVNSQFEIP